MLGEEDRQSSFLASQGAVNITLEDHPDRAGFLNNLRSGLGDRYSRIRAITNLEEAIRIIRETIDVTLKDYPDRIV